MNNLVLAFYFDVSHNHRSHLLGNVNSRNPVSHTLLPAGSGERAAGYIKQGRRLSPFPTQGVTTPIYLLNQCTLRIRQIDSLNFSTVSAISPLRAFTYSDFDWE